MAHYLVTGTAGFIAARVTEMLLEAGHSVLGVDNMNPAYDIRMKEYRLGRLSTRKGFNFKQLDIADWEAVSALGRPGDSGTPFSAVINLAARAGVRASQADPWVYLETNQTGTLNLLELCRREGIHKFVLASTSSVYGEGAPRPTPEDYDSSHPLQPYAASKKGAEVMAHAYHYLYGIDVTVFRYFTVYGPAGRPDMSMFRFTQWIAEGRPVKVFGDGEQSRGFTYIDDIARGTIAGLAPLGFEIMNLGGHEEITIHALIRQLEARIGKAAHLEYHPPHPADMRANHARVDKAGRLLGWEPIVNLQEGIDRMVTWYQEERAWASRIKTD